MNSAMNNVISVHLRYLSRPRCLTWSDEQVAEVERWLVDFAVLPEVLRG